MSDRNKSEKDYLSSIEKGQEKQSKQLDSVGSGIGTVSDMMGKTNKGQNELISQSRVANDKLSGLNATSRESLGVSMGILGQSRITNAHLSLLNATTLEISLKWESGLMRWPTMNIHWQQEISSY